MTLIIITSLYKRGHREKEVKGRMIKEQTEEAGETNLTCVVLP
jgi:hypothetical protein